MVKPNPLGKILDNSYYTYNETEGAINYDPNSGKRLGTALQWAASGLVGVVGGYAFKQSIYQAIDVPIYMGINHVFSKIGSNFPIIRGLDSDSVKTAFSVAGSALITAVGVVAFQTFGGSWNYFSEEPIYYVRKVVVDGFLIPTVTVQAVKAVNRLINLKNAKLEPTRKDDTTTTEKKPSCFERCWSRVTNFSWEGRVCCCYCRCGKDAASEKSAGSQTRQHSEAAKTRGIDETATSPTPNQTTGTTGHETKEGAAPDGVHRRASTVFVQSAQPGKSGRPKYGTAGSAEFRQANSDAAAGSGSRSEGKGSGRNVHFE